MTATRQSLSEAGVHRIRRVSRERQYLVHNRTPREIRVCAGGDRLHLSPLGERVMCGEVLVRFEPWLRILQDRHDVSIRPHVAVPEARMLAPGLLAGGLVLLLGAMAVAALTGLGPWKLAGGSIGVSLVLAALVVAARHERQRRIDEQDADVIEGDIDSGTGGQFYTGNEVIGVAARYAALLGVLLFGVAMPTVAIVTATDTRNFLGFDSGLFVVSGMESRLVGRAIQVVYVVILSTFPALMYFQFDRQRAGTLRGQWVRSIFRIDGRMRNLSDVNARYGSLISEASYFRTDSSRTLGGRNSPLIIATVLVALGWTILVARTDSFDFDRANDVRAVSAVAQASAERAGELADETVAVEDPEQAAAAAERAVEASETAKAAAAEAEEIGASAGGATAAGTVPTATTVPSAVDGLAEAREVASRVAAEAAAAAEAARAAETEVASIGTFQLLAPNPSPAGMAFLGAYFFAVYLVLRAYLRGDLRPKVYNQIAARLVTVVVIAYLIGVLVPGEQWVVLSLSFLAGITPNSVVRKVGEFGGDKPIIGGLFGDAFGQDRPLTRIDGIDIYERERLASEGINDIEALAHNDLVATMVNTRIPMERLIDWADQAALVLHLGETEGSESEDSTLDDLRRIGVRTASSVIQLSVSEPDNALRIQTEAHLGGEGRLAPFAEILGCEPIMRQVIQWKGSLLGDPSHPTRPIVEGDDSGGHGRSAAPPEDRVVIDDRTPTTLNQSG